MSKILSKAISFATSIGGGIERNDRLGALAGLGSLAVLLAADLAWGESVVLTGTFIVAPFIAALWAGVGVTVVVSLAALAAAALSGAWNMNFGGTDYEVRMAVLFFGSVLAVASAWARERARQSTKRLELLDEVGAIADGSLPLAETLERVLGVIVTPFADFCMVDAIHDRRVIRSAVRAGGRDDLQDVERYLRERAPSLPDWMTRREAPFPRHPRFIPRFTDDDLKRLSHDPDDLERLRELGLSSAITVAMIARGRLLGALTFGLSWSGRNYSIEDVRFAQALAGRVALALDNAGLFSDLESVERRMDNVMSLLDEAVVIHDAQGELIFANPAAKTLMGFEPSEDPTIMSMAEIEKRFQVRAEDGRRLAAEAVLGQRALSDTADGPLVVRAMVEDSHRERWLVTRAKPIMGPDGQPLYSVTAMEDVTALKRAEFSQRILANVGDLVATSSDHDLMLRGFAELVVPDFAEWCTIDVPSETGVIEQAALAHEDDKRRRLVADLRNRYPVHASDPDGIAEVIRSGSAQLIAMPDEMIERIAIDEEHARLMRWIGLRSAMMVPMTSGGRTLGAVAFGNGPDGRDFDEEDLELAVELARRAGTAVENARLAEERAEVARVLQEGLMPPALPHMRGWETAAVYQPAGEVNAVGGDFYDAFEVEGGWMVVVGDVVGRGAAAASLTALARHTIRTSGLLTGDPCTSLALLDTALRARGEIALCTAAILILPRVDDGPAEISFVSAGHPLPLRIRDGEVEDVGTPGPLLGAFESSRWTPERIELLPGDQLVLYTDGVIEARGKADRFGEARLRAQLVGADRPLTAVGKVTAALEAFLGGEPDDDVAVVALRRAGTRQLSPSPERSDAGIALPS